MTIYLPQGGACANEADHDEIETRDRPPAGPQIIRGVVER